jgi:small-conductance mechanosensitive channel
LAGIYLAFTNLPLKPVASDILQKALLVVILLSATVVLSKIVVGFIGLHGKKTAGGLPSASLFTNITKGVIFAIGLLIILQSLGISVTPLITALGVGGLAVALALQPTLSNLFAGLQIIASKQLEPGDWVELDSGAKGFVVDINWRNTTIQELPNNLIVVPNSQLANSIITNFNRPQKQMAVRIEVGVSYDSDLAKVEKVTVDVAKSVVKEIQGGDAKFEPIVRYHTFSDFSINFTVILRVKEFVNKYLVRHEFIKALHKRYKEEGIEIPFPIRTVHMKGTDFDKPER